MDENNALLENKEQKYIDESKEAYSILNRIKRYLEYSFDEQKKNYEINHSLFENKLIIGDQCNIYIKNNKICIINNQNILRLNIPPFSQLSSIDLESICESINNMLFLFI